MHQAKLEAQKQWNTDPCGAISAAGLEEGSLEYFEAIETYRYKEYARWMERTIGVDRFCGRKVLEIGPGLGTDLLQFGSHGAQCYAVDLTQKHLALTRENFQLHGVTVACFVGDAEALPFKDGIFDCVYAFGVLHHTPNTKLAVAEIHRVLKDGGKAIVGLYHRNSTFYWMSTMLFRGVLLMGLMRKGYRRLLSEIEFRSPDSDASPLVEVYSRNQIRALFGRFRSQNLRRVIWNTTIFPAARTVKIAPGFFAEGKNYSFVRNGLETPWVHRAFFSIFRVVHNRGG